jgi:hypothetical protein
MNHRKRIEESARHIATAAKALKPAGSAFCVLMWGPDESGEQWMTYVHDVAPSSGHDDRGSCRRVLAASLRDFADIIESRADLTPGVVGHG